MLNAEFVAASKATSLTSNGAFTEDKNQPLQHNAHTLQIPVAARAFSPSMIKPKQEKIQNT